MILFPLFCPYTFACNPTLTYKMFFSIGMENYRVSTSRKQQIDMARKKFTSGEEVTTPLHPMARVWKCVPKELSLILKIKYAWFGSPKPNSSGFFFSQLDGFKRFKWYHSLASDYRNIVLQIEPQLLSAKNVMIAAHGNSLRSIIMYLDKLTSQEVTDCLWYLDVYHLCWFSLLFPFNTSI